MYEHDTSSKALFVTFIDKSFFKDSLIQACQKKGVKAAGRKDYVISECLELYSPTQLMRELEVAKIFQWHEKLIIICLLSGQKTASQILSNELTETVLAKQLPIAAFGQIYRDLFSFEKSKEYLHRRIHNLKKKGIISLSPTGRAYYLNPLMIDYFREVFGSISGEQICEDAVSWASEVMSHASWSPYRFKAWVSKTDIIELLRCEYRVFIAHKLGKQPTELVDSEFIKSIIERGSTFEDNVVNKLPFKEVGSINEVIDQQVIFRSTEIVENHKLGIRGIIDLIDTSNGQLFPIEIKSHKHVEKSDRLELAFYWKLLEPLRKGRPTPKGYMWLNTGEIIEVVLSEDDFTRLESLIQRVRLVKEIVPEPIICDECDACTLKDDCISDVHKRGGLSLIHGIASIRQKQLHQLGIEDIHTLALANADNLHDEWRGLSPFAPGVLEIQKMILHARSWIELSPIYFGKQSFPIGDKFIIIDLEYDPVSLIWLVGILVVNSQETKCYQFFADTTEQEKYILTMMLDVLDQYRDFPILTWAGLGADFPQLEKAWSRLSLPLLDLNQLVEKHLDLYQLTLSSCRFPLKHFGLKEIGRHLGFVRKHQDIDGFVALGMYNQYLALPKTNEKERLAIKNILLEYNREDLDATLHVLKQLKTIAPEGEATENSDIDFTKQRPKSRYVPSEVPEPDGIKNMKTIIKIVDGKKVMTVKPLAIP